MSPLKVGMLNILLILGFFAFPFTHADSQAAEELSGAQKAQVEKIVHDYLVKHPQVLLEASQALQAQQNKAMQQQAQAAIKENVPALFQHPISTSAGNPDGKIIVLEFSDYQCGHCRRVAPILAELMKADAQLKVIIKQWPIFGAVSEFAAKAVLAAQKQNKAWELHQALMLSKQQLSEQVILDTAKALGINIAALQKEMQNSVYAEELKANMQLADKLGIAGTPVFIVASGTQDKSGKTTHAIFIPGATDKAELEKAVTQLKNS